MAGAVSCRPEADALCCRQRGLIQAVAQAVDKRKHLHGPIGIEANTDPGFAFEVHRLGFRAINRFWRVSDDRRMSCCRNHGGMISRDLLLRWSNLYGNRAAIAGTRTARNAV